MSKIHARDELKGINAANPAFATLPVVRLRTDPYAARLAGNCQSVARAWLPVVLSAGALLGMPTSCPVGKRLPTGQPSRKCSISPARILLRIGVSFVAPLGREQCKHRPADHLLRAIPEQGLGAAVPTGDVPSHVLADDGIVGGLNDPPSRRSQTCSVACVVDARTCGHASSGREDKFPFLTHRQFLQKFLQCIIVRNFL